MDTIWTPTRKGNKYGADIHHNWVNRYGLLCRLSWRALAPWPVGPNPRPTLILCTVKVLWMRRISLLSQGHSRQHSMPSEAHRLHGVVATCSSMEHAFWFTYVRLWTASADHSIERRGVFTFMLTSNTRFRWITDGFDQRPSRIPVIL